ncbi:hypothetical protein [Kitasatospora griseola]|uniref:hypothetical protein n=1 Tax=Kitasatospora griseola TaxID=2064 RepID=UPI003649C86C
MPGRPMTATPRRFLCEHTAAKSRVLVLVDHPDGPASLQAVLTCREPVLAHRAAQLLQRALGSTPQAWPAAAVDRLCEELPDAPAASLHQAVSQALAGAWPATEGSVLPWPDSPLGEEDELFADHSARTPHDARLSDLAGPVVQVAMLREYHVYDEDALLKAATASGWKPLPGVELDEVDPKDIVGAVMSLASDGSEVEGADIVSDQSSADFLLADRGDEVADWSTTPVIADFGVGWRSTPAEGERSTVAGEDRELPDFAKLFAVEPSHCEDPECEEEACRWRLTPRTADLLHTALSVLADQAYDHAEELGDRPVGRQEAEDGWEFFTALPPLTFAADLQWRRQMARAVDDLAGDLEQGKWPEPTCTAEEVALHLALRDAPDYLDEVEEYGTSHQDLPVHRDDYDFEMCGEIFFQDTDFLMLYSRRYDGIEDPDGDVNQQFGIGDLRTEAWFEPFQNVDPRDPRRGFRR